MRSAPGGFTADVSSVMGLYPSEFVARLKQRGIAWFANISTVAEACAAEAAGADVIVAQGMEAGGHRGSFDGAEAERILLTQYAPPEPLAGRRLADDPWDRAGFM